MVMKYCLRLADNICQVVDINESRYSDFIAVSVGVIG